MRLRKALIIFILILPVTLLALDASFTIDSKEISGPNTKFWQACGQDFLFRLVNRPMGQELLKRFNEHQSMRYMRTHYTFSNKVKLDKAAGGPIGGNVAIIDDKGNIHYDFSIINQTFHQYVKNGIKPIVEFDFFPDGMSADFEMNINDEGFGFKVGAPRDWQEWETLLQKFMQNLTQEFGQKELRTWYFEVWNEPDNWPHEHIDVFFRLYDVFSHVIKSFDPEYKVGGPGCFHLSFLKEFFDHVTHGTNYVTGQVGSPIDFFSYHIYGLSGSWLEKSPLLYPSVNRFNQQILWLQRLVNKYPELKDVEFHLNEWGMSSHFQRTVSRHPELEYRNSEASALFLTKMIDCMFAIRDDHNFETRLLLYWGFNWEAELNIPFNGNRELTTAGNIPKPILTGYEMLAKLGNQRLKVTGPKPGGRLGVLAAKKCNKHLQFIVYNYNETDTDLSIQDRLSITLDKLEGTSATIRAYKMDRDSHNTYRAWQQMGSPTTFTIEQIDQLTHIAELTVKETNTVQIKNKNLLFNFSIPRHSMTLYEIETN